ncbi:hypothetical protein DINM_003580 [Dirofilaria immitis]|nr:hypothetical protein [Dirofilaria immitis]
MRVIFNNGNNNNNNEIILASNNNNNDNNDIISCFRLTVPIRIGNNENRINVEMYNHFPDYWNYSMYKMRDAAFSKYWPNSENATGQIGEIPNAQTEAYN